MFLNPVTPANYRDPAPVRLFGSVVVFESVFDGAVYSSYRGSGPFRAIFVLEQDAIKHCIQTMLRESTRDTRCTPFYVNAIIAWEGGASSCIIALRP